MSEPISGDTPIKPAKKFWESANLGIVGLSLLQSENGDDVTIDWPTEGYDGHLHECRWHKWPEGSKVPLAIEGVFKQSGHTKAEWLELADVMIARWQEWKAEIEGTPEE